MPVGEYLAFDSRDVTDVEETWQQFVPSARLQRVDPRTFGFSWSSYAMPDFSVVTYDLAASVQSAIDPADQVMACRVASRGSRVSTPRGDLNAGMPWLAAGGPTAARWSDRATVRAFILDRAFLEHGARQMVGDDRFTVRTGGLDSSPLHHDLGAQWERTFQHVAASVFTPHGSGSLVDAELRRHALYMTLATFSRSFVESEERTAQRSAAPRTVRSAIAFIETHAHEPITVDDIARAARISTRGLQYAFRRALGVTPTEYLRRERLARAHAELRDGLRMPVAEVARRWGFTSPSRFAKQYREVYGRNPSQTVRVD